MSSPLGNFLILAHFLIIAAYITLTMLEDGHCAVSHAQIATGGDDRVHDGVCVPPCSGRAEILVKDLGDLLGRIP